MYCFVYSSLISKFNTNIIYFFSNVDGARTVNIEIMSFFKHRVITCFIETDIIKTVSKITSSLYEIVILDSFFTVRTTIKTRRNKRFYFCRINFSIISQKELRNTRKVIVFKESIINTLPVDQKILCIPTINNNIVI